MKSRVIPYGIGKTILTIKMPELPQDIQKGIIDRYEKREGKAKITQNTDNIIILCEEILAKN